ncbi:MAG: cytochrome c biogenesis protein CcsA [Planctomycetes bacterium]|nr:cytochrome c biogenesis protein CcsA [Planctomycetota bacterium]
MYPFHQHFLLCLGFFLYVPASVTAIVHLVRRGEMASRVTQVLAGGAALCHTSLLALRAVECGAFPVLTALESLLLFLVLVTVLVLFLGRRFRLPTVVSFSVPLITAISAGSFLLVRPPAELPEAHPLLLASHVSLTVISYVAFTLGFVTGAMYLAQARQLKSHRPGPLLWLLPPLEVTEAISVRTIAAGWLMLSLGIALGALGLYLGREKLPADAPWHADPKIVWTGLTWVVYTGIVLIHFLPRFRGLRWALVGVLGFGFLIFTYFGAHFLGSGFHRY